MTRFLKGSRCFRRRFFISSSSRIHSGWMRNPGFRRNKLINQLMNVFGIWWNSWISKSKSRIRDFDFVKGISLNLGEYDLRLQSLKLREITKKRLVMNKTYSLMMCDSQHFKMMNSESMRFSQWMFLGFYKVQQLKSSIHYMKRVLKTICKIKIKVLVLKTKWFAAFVFLNKQHELKLKIL